MKMNPGSGDSTRSPLAVPGKFTMSPATRNKFALPDYKLRPIYPVPTTDLDFEHSNFQKLHASCSECFPMQSVSVQGNYVNLLDFSQFNGMPYGMTQKGVIPSRWFADIRYTISTPLPHKYPRVGTEVLSSKRVEAAIEIEIAKDPTNTMRSLQKKAAKFYNEIRSSLSRFVCKICAWVLYKVFRKLMSKLLVNPDQIALVQQAERTGIPIVYLPLHRSHLDYLLITWCNWHFGLRLPHIASGDNLNLGGFGWLLRATGAFFIRRRVDPSDVGGRDALYRAVLHSYIEQLLKISLPIEFFLEGTRSRFGKALVPKHGLISNVIEAVQQNIIQDVYLVPVSYTYDNIAEGIFLNELMGIPKTRESFIGVIREVWKGFRKNQPCGMVRMHYGRPIKLTDYLRSLRTALANKRYGAPSQLSRMPHSYSYRELVPWVEEHETEVSNRALIRAIGYHAIHEAQSMMSISPVSILSALLLNKYRDGASRETLELDVEWLCERVLEAKREVMGWVPGVTSGENLIEYALKFVKDAVKLDDDQIIPIRTRPQLLFLAYKRNALVPVFGFKAAIALSLLSRPTGKSYPFSEIMEDSLSICDWLQYEVIFCKPCDDMHALITEMISEKKMGDSHFGLLDLEYDEMDAKIEDSKIRIRDGHSYEILRFYADFLRPFLQSLCIVVNRLSEGFTGKVKEQQFVRNLCSQSIANIGALPFEPVLESINSDSFKNSIRILRQKGFLADDEVNVELSPNINLSDVKENVLRVITISPFLHSIKQEDL